MALTQYYTATTLDGFIAGPDNSLDWLFVQNQDKHGVLNYDAFVAEVGAAAIGATTYEWILEHSEEWPYEFPCWVFTHRQLPERAGVELTSGDVAAVHEEMVDAAAGRKRLDRRRRRPRRTVRRRWVARRGDRLHRAGHARRGRAAAAAAARPATGRA